MSTTKQKLDLKKVKEEIFNDIDTLLNRLDVEYQLNNNNIFMPCPIHGGDNPSGLSISLDRKTWKCWTHNCHEDFGADIFGFVKGCRQDPTFSDTLRFICNTYNINNKHTSKEVNKPEIVKTELEEIVSIFKPTVITFNEKNYVRDVLTLDNSIYFENRGFLPSTLSVFGVKDCVDKTSPMFNRAIIPVYFNEKEIGYIARATKDYIQPKYLFSSGLKKTDYLYNYDNAIKVSKNTHALFLVEGQGDVWKLYEAGIKNVVGLFGKDLSESQKGLLIRSGVSDIVILTDNDQAGREGRMKIQRELSRMFNLIYPPMLKKDVGDMKVEQIKEYILPHVEGLY
jgi:5S rRNA maturation endonuclease (ribonuclease M5)